MPWRTMVPEGEPPVVRQFDQTDPPIGLDAEVCEGLTASGSSHLTDSLDSFSVYRYVDGGAARRALLDELDPQLTLVADRGTYVILADISREEKASGETSFRHHRTSGVFLSNCVLMSGTWTGSLAPTEQAVVDALSELSDEAGAAICGAPS